MLYDRVIILLGLFILTLLILIVHLGRCLKRAIVCKIEQDETIESLHILLFEKNTIINQCQKSCEWHLVYMIETYTFIRNLSFILKKMDSLDGLGCEMDKYQQYLSGAIKSGLKAFPDNFYGTRYESVSATLRRYHRSTRRHLKHIFRGLI